MDTTRNYGYYGDADLGEFLRRPVKILDRDWLVFDGSISEIIDPWELFLKNFQVRSRVEGYRNLQGTLHLRIAINGGPFIYGRAIAAYYPQPVYNEHSFGPPTSEYYKQQLSMLPHVFLDPTASEGGEIVCPFFCPDNWIDLIGGNYTHMGRLHICSINNLLHANSSTAKANIAVYAWMTDVRLAGPTTRNYESYEAHSGDELTYGAAALSVLGAVLTWMNHVKCSYVGEDRHSDHVTVPHAEAVEPHSGDEYGSGIISKPASAVAKAAGILANIPSIRPFARPTEMVASAVGRMAHVFGYSRPTIVSDLCRVRMKNAGNLANTDQHEAVTKLSLDSKQELSIDPRTVGLSDVDEMSFNYIKQKECYMSTMEWTESDVGETQLGLITVGPDFHNRALINGHGLTLPAPMYTVAAPFKYWRGSIKLRFQLVASQLHRGRLRFSYDPYVHGAGSPDENETYSRIIDLATNRDFEMVISWNHPHSWLRVNDRFGASLYNHPVGTVTNSKNFHNGQVLVEVVNELTSPNPFLAQPVYINLFVSAGEDFEVACPTDDILKYCEYEPQTGDQTREIFEPQSGTEGEEVIADSDNIPESPAPIVPVGKIELPDNPNSHVFFGESFASIRALLKRYCYHMSYFGTNGVFCHFITESNFPVEPGQGRTPRHVTAASATPSLTPYTYSAMTYLNWFTPCYVGWRGGLRSKYVLTNTSRTSTIFVRRFAEPVDQADCGLLGYGSTAYSDNQYAYNSRGLLNCHAGGEIVPVYTDGVAEVEFPFYSHKRFAPARKFLDGSDTDSKEWTGENGGHLVACTYSDSSIGAFVHRYVAAGDDFSLFMWVGQPGVLRRTPPVADGASTSLPLY